LNDFEIEKNKEIDIPFEDITVKNEATEQGEVKDLGESAEQQSSRREKRRKSRNTKNGVIVFLIFAALWGGAVYYGYNYVKDYIDTLTANIQQTNAMQTSELREEISLLGSEIRNLRGSMENAGLVISNTSDVQTRIDEKLVELENQLKELEHSLNILKEAPNAP